MVPTMCVDPCTGCSFTVCRPVTEMQAVTRTVPIILCTSKSQETDKIWGMRQGARDYIVKPVDRDELLAKITALG